MHNFTQFLCFIFILNASERISNYGKFLNIEVETRLGRVMNKKLQSPENIFGKAKKN